MLNVHDDKSQQSGKRRGGVSAMPLTSGALEGRATIMGIHGLYETENEDTETVTNNATNVANRRQDARLRVLDTQ